MGRIFALCAMFVGLCAVGCGGDSGKSGDVETTIDDGPAALTKETSATFVFHSAPIGRGFVCEVDSLGPGECTSPFVATVAEGDHVFMVSALDSKSHPDTTPATRSWRVDTTPPDTAITKQPAAIDNTATPSFEFTGTDTGGGALTFECSLDGGTFASCASPYDSPALADGNHAFAVRAVDAAGNADTTPASAAWLVDTTSPDTMITSGPADASTSGPTPIFTFGSSIASPTFECKLDAGAFAACTTPFTTPALVDGAHVFTVRAKDGNGVVDPTPPMRSWTVDAIAPDIAITATPPNPSNNPTPMFAFASSDPTATFECQVNNSAFAACATPFTTPALPDGANTFHVRAVDPVGNRSPAPALYAWTIDTNPPSVTITGAPPTPSNDTTPTTSFTTLGSPTTISCQIDSGAPVTPCVSPYTPAALPEGSHTITIVVADAAGNTGMAMAAFDIDLTPPMVAITSGPIDPTPTNNKTPTFTFTASGATSVLCAMDGGAFSACTSPYVSASLADGAHTFYVRGIDAVGNAQTASQAFTIDSVAPTVTITGFPPNPTNQATPQFTFTVTGGPAVTTCQVDAGAFNACTSPFTTPALSEASHTVTIHATDTANNTGSAAKTFTVDLTAPVVTITNPPSSPTSMNNITVNFTVSGGAVGTQCQLDGGAFGACTTGSSFTTGAMTDGSHTITIKSTDSAGNAGTATATFTVDTGAPVVTITASPANPTNNPVASVTFTVTGSPTTITCQLDAGPFTACTSPYMTGSLADGSHTITVKATDAANNSGTAFRTFTVDTTAPVVTITAPFIPAFTNTNTPTVTFTVTGGAVSTQCQVDGGAFASCSSPFTTTTLADGAHAITIHSTDAVGNVGTATASFTVDTVAPTVMITTTFANNLTNNNRPPIAFTTAGSPTSTTCQIDAQAPVACSSPFTPGAALGEGSHTIIVKVTDAATNSSQAMITFTVDTIAPVLTFAAVPPAHTNDNTPTVTFNVDGTQTSLQCSVDGGAFATCTSPFTATTLADGAHSIAVRATDLATNATTITTNFAVDTVPPTVMITTTFANNLTNNNRPPIAFTSAGQSTTQCQIDGGAFAACVSAFTPGSALIDGSHTIVVLVTDLAGNTAQDSITFTVDTQAPTVTLTSVPPNPTNNASPQITFTTAGGPNVIDCKLDAAAFAPCSSPYFPGTLADGSHTIIVRVTDLATNTSQASTTFVVDTVAPTVTVTPVTDPTKTASNSVTFTTAGSPSSVQCQIDAGVFSACTSPFVTGALADGTHTVTVKVTDLAGNSSTGSTTFTVDTMAPTATITVAPPNPTNNTTPSITFTTAGSPNTIQCQVDAGAFAACTSPFTVGAALADGSHSITVKVTDLAGNSSTATTGAFVVDTVAPVITLGAVTDPTNNRTQPLTFTVTGSPTLVECETDALGFATCTSPFTPSSMADGSHTLSVRATDAANNVSVKTTPAFVVDGTAPVVTVTPVASPTNNNRPPVAFSVTGSPNTIKCQIDAAAFATCTSPFTPGSALADGSHTITVQATDLAGNVGTDSTTFTVDTTAPTVTVSTQPPAQWNSTTATVTFTTGGSPTTIDCRADGAAYAPCTTSFTQMSLTEALHQYDIFVQDAAGNSFTKSITFTVDVTPPTVAITAQPPASTNDNTPTITFTTGGSPSSTTCSIDGGAAVACTSPFTTGALADGSHTIKVTVTDAATNTASDTTTPFTIDTAPPVVTITSGPQHGWPTASGPQTFTFTASADATQITCKVDANAAAPCTSPFTTSALSAGNHSILVTAIDAATNSGSATATNVADPTIMCLLAPSDRGDADVSTLVEALTKGTVEYWFRGKDPAAKEEQLQFEDPASQTAELELSYNAGDFVLNIAGAANQRTFTPPTGFDVTAWHHYAWVFTTTTAKLFIDGVEDTVVTQDAGAMAAGFDTAFTTHTNAQLHVGQRFDGVLPTQGAFLDVRVSNLALYNATFTPVFPLTTVAGSALLQYPANEGTGAQSIDKVHVTTRMITWSNPSGWNNANCFQAP